MLYDKRDKVVHFFFIFFSLLYFSHRGGVEIRGTHGGQVLTLPALLRAIERCSVSDAQVNPFSSSLTQKSGADVRIGERGRERVLYDPQCQYFIRYYYDII